MKGLGDLNKSGNSSTLTLLKQAESASNGEAGGGKGLFEKFSESGSPFDPQAEDEQEEDIHDVTQVVMTSHR